MAASMDVFNSISQAADQTSDNFSEMVMWLQQQSQQGIENEQWDKMYRLNKDRFNMENRNAMQEFQAKQQALDWQTGFRNALMRGTAQNQMTLKGGTA